MPISQGLSACLSYGPKPPLLPPASLLSGSLPSYTRLFVVSFFLLLCLQVSVHAFLSVSFVFNLSHCVSTWLPLCLYLSFSLSYCIRLSNTKMSLCLCSSVSVFCLCIFMYFPQYLSPCLSPSAFISFRGYVGTPLSVCLPVSLLCLSLLEAMSGHPCW